MGDRDRLEGDGVATLRDRERDCEGVGDRDGDFDGDFDCDRDCDLDRGIFSD